MGKGSEYVHMRMYSYRQQQERYSCTRKCKYINRV